MCKYKKELNEMTHYLNRINSNTDYNISVEIVMTSNIDFEGYIELTFRNEERLFTTEDYWNFTTNIFNNRDRVILNKIKNIKSEMEFILLNGDLEEFIEKVKDIIY